MSIRYAGPATIDCPKRCDVPAGTTLAVVPVPRHAWGDVLTCPNGRCDRAFIVMAGAPPSAAAAVPCCDLHNEHCEPPAELCCEDCTEVNHPNHPLGVACTWRVPPEPREARP